MHFGYPFRIDENGRTASPDEDTHIRQLIEQVLFTSPGERVNRPTLGSGLMSMVFAPASEALGAAVQQLVQSSLQQWLGDRIQVEGVNVEQRDSTLQVTVRYLVRRTQERQTLELTREV